MRVCVYVLVLIPSGGLYIPLPLVRPGVTFFEMPHAKLSLPAPGGLPGWKSSNKQANGLNFKVYRRGGAGSLTQWQRGAFCI